MNWEEDIAGSGTKSKCDERVCNETRPCRSVKFQRCSGSYCSLARYFTTTMNSPARRSEQLVSALPSSLSKRSKPPVPPASQVYDPLIKHVLAQRFARHVLAVSAAASWIIAALWTPWAQGKDANRILSFITYALSIRTLFHAAGWWTLGALPLALVRRTNIKCM